MIHAKAGQVSGQQHTSAHIIPLGGVGAGAQHEKPEETKPLAVKRAKKRGARRGQRPKQWKSFPVAVRGHASLFWLWLHRKMGRPLMGEDNLGEWRACQVSRTTGGIDVPQSRREYIEID